MKQLFALDFSYLRIAGRQFHLPVSPTSISDKLTQLKKSQTVSKNRKISKIPVVVLFIDRFPKNLNNSPPDRGLATKHTNKIFAT